MVKVFDPTKETQNEIHALASDILTDAIEEICEKYGLSALSASTALFHVNCTALSMLGGNHSRQYMQRVADGVFAKSRDDLAKIDKKLRIGMEQMAAHYDLLAGRTVGSA